MRRTRAPGSRRSARTEHLGGSFGADNAEGMPLIVRVHLAYSHGGRQPGPYLVDDVEARALALVQTANGPLLEPRIDAVLQQVDHTEDEALDGALALAAALFPVTDGADAVTTATEEPTA